MKLLSVIFTLALLVGGCTTFESRVSREATKVQILKYLGPNTTQVHSFTGIEMNANNDEVLKDEGYGTGFIVKYKNKKYVMTNAHVCDKPTNQVRLYQNRQAGIFMKAKIIAFDMPKDLCLLESEFTNLGDGVELGDPQDIDLYGTYATLGMNGLRDAKVPQLGLFLQRDVAFTRLDETVDIDVLNIDQDAGRATLLCAPPSKLVKQYHPLVPDMWRYLCVLGELQDIYDFQIIPGSSGSSVISLRTGKLVGVVSQYVHPQRMYGGVIPLETVKLFLELNIK